MMLGASMPTAGYGLSVRQSPSYGVDELQLSDEVCHLQRGGADVDRLITTVQQHEHRYRNVPQDAERRIYATPQQSIVTGPQSVRCAAAGRAVCRPVGRACRYYAGMRTHLLSLLLSIGLFSLHAADVDLLGGRTLTVEIVAETDTT